MEPNVFNQQISTEFVFANALPHTTYFSRLNPTHSPDEQKVRACYLKKNLIKLSWVNTIKWRKLQLNLLCLLTISEMIGLNSGAF